MNEQPKPTPEVKLADGNIKMSGFRTNGKHGDFLSFTIQRSYQDGEEIKYADNFSGDDLLKVCRLVQKAYDEHKEFAARGRRIPQTRD